MNISGKIRINIFPILILIVGLILAFKNYTPNTFLSGWDTLHPEFDFGLSFKRELPGVFRLNQGLGAVAGHSDMADFPHILILYLLNFFLSMDLLRYSYIFLGLIAGSIGMYFFLKSVVLKNKTASFLGALFYLLNLGTMQLFVVPFEMFVTQYALLPWLFLFATNYIYQKKKTMNLIFFALATFMSTPIAFAATLWYFQFFAFIIYILILTFPKEIKRALVLIGLTILMNLFWILPNLYFVFNYGADVQNANINKMFSKEAFLYNKEFGNIKDLSLLKNFLFDWSVYSGNNQFTQLLSPWIEHLKRPFVEQIGFLFTLMSLTGFIYAIRRKNKILIALAGPLLLSLFFLINDNPPTSPLYNVLKNMPLFSEAFRFPQNKALGVFIFAFAIYFAFFQLIIIRFLNYLSYNNLKIKFAHILIVVALIGYFMLPAFKSNFISPYMRIEIPQEYFELFSWFKNQDPTARIANLPIHSQWGWEYYNWGFQGAGFIWFGIEQPLLNRDFDRWDKANEQYYREMSQAIYSRDLAKLTNVLQKYDIAYILVDKNTIDPEQGKNNTTLFFNEIEMLLTQSPTVQRVAHFGNLFVYQTNFGKQQVRLIENPTKIAPIASSFYDDFAYFKYKDYITYLDLKKNTVFYPFRDIMDNQSRLTSNIIPQSYSDKVIRQDVSAGKTINECSPSIKDNSISEKRIMKENSEKFVRYSSFSGSFCSHYSFQSLSRSQGYLISITSRNITGLPLKLCVINYISRRCDLYARLSQSPIFNEDTFILPPIGEGVGFDININNFAVTKSPSINDLKSIKITPFPYSDLLQIEQYNPMGDSRETNVIVFSQSFDKGWKAYEVQSSKFKVQSWMNNIFPFVFGKELKEHVLVNNWANGWVLDSNLAMEQFNNSHIVIIFWPQYLEYLGIGILIGTFVWVFYFFRKN